MQSLGDFLPEKTKEILADSNFKVGSVLRYFVPFTNPPKEKRLIIVGFDKDTVLFASVLINTEVNANLFRTDEIRDLHLGLDTNGRDYISHPCYVDCSKVFEQDIELIKRKLVETPDIHKGHLSEQDLTDVKEKIKAAKTIPPKMKKKYGFL